MAEMLPENGICPKCAQELLSNSSTCPNCGHRLPSQMDRGLVSTLCTLLAIPLFCGGGVSLILGMFVSAGYIYVILGIVGILISVALLPMIASGSGNNE